MISKKEVAELANRRENYCVSIFVPTSPSGAQVRRKKDAIALKNQLKEVRIKLSGQGLGQHDIEAFVAPAKKLIEDKEFWSHQADGLAVFMSRGFSRWYSLPMSFEPFNYVARGFYLKPLMPLFAGDGSFYLLALALDRVALYEASKYEIKKIRIKELVPMRMEESVGYDYEDKGLQFRNQREGFGEVLYHGHAEADRDTKDEIRRYFRDISKGLMELLRDKDLPLLVVCQDYLFPIYREVNQYKHLLERHVDHDVAHMDDSQLHALGWNHMKPHFAESRHDRISKFKRFAGTDRTTTLISDIMPAAKNGSVETLFCMKNTDITGSFNEDTGEVRVYDEPSKESISLMNLAAIQVFLNGGYVYCQEKDEMPNPGSNVNALLRY